ncbi:MAG: hypothetical protein ACXABY_21270 [Candidatus Thorarchaeota archaeon]|jgi:hypothetical protein
MATTRPQGVPDFEAIEKQPRMPEVREELAVYERHLEALEEAALDLRFEMVERIQSVIRPMVEEKEPPAPCNKPTCTLAQNIHELNSRLMTLIRKINNTINSVQL